MANVDLKKPYNLANDEEWAAYLERRKEFQKWLLTKYQQVERRPREKMDKLPLQIRPFLSSTFRDFNEERNLCFMGAFPRLEKMCNERGVSSLCTRTEHTKHTHTHTHTYTHTH